MESARRLECYDTIFERFGKERVAVTAMPETYRARRALRDTGLALGIAPADVDRIAKSFPHLRASDITNALAELPELRQLAAEAHRFGPLWELAEGLDSLVHGMAMHPCGVVISDATLLDRLPVQPTPQGDYPMAMAAKEEIEALGNIKLDVLGVRMQSAMAHAVTEIERATGNRIDLDDPQQVPLDDVFAFKLIQESQTLGLFQLESPASRTCCPGSSPVTCRTSSPTSASSAPALSPAACPSGTSPPATAAPRTTPTRTWNPCSPTPTA